MTLLYAQGGSGQNSHAQKWRENIVVRVTLNEDAVNELPGMITETH